MSDFPLCTRKSVKLRNADSTFRDEECWTFGDFAVGRRKNDRSQWTIYHLPSGAALASASGVFRYEASAVAAMQEIGRAKNNWILPTAAEIEATRTLVVSICQKHGGMMPDPRTIHHRDTDSLDQTHNREIPKMVDMDHTKSGIFVSHRCAKCDDGARPCIRRSPSRCEVSESEE